jgi:signal transduction histidine kinase
VVLVHVSVLAVQPGPLLRSGGQPNPLGVPGADAWLPVAMLASALLLPIGPVLLWRHRRRTVAAYWYLSGAVLLVTALLVDVAGVAGISPYGEALSWSLHLATLPLLPGVVLAVELRREPLRRLLVWTLLPLGLVWSYLSVVGWLAAVLRVRAGVGVTLLAAVAVAVAFEPARSRLERAADRLVYGDRRDPLAVLNQIAAHLPPPGGAGTLDRVAAEVVARMRLAGFTVELARVGGWEPTAHAGAVTAAPADAGLMELPLVDHGEIVGRVLAHCRPGDRFTAADHELLVQICRQLTTAVVAHRAAVDLRRSRARLVSARAEERHRLGRDLHDDLGPALAGIALGLRAAANRVTAGSPAGVADLLDALGRQSTLAAEQVRRLAHELHPPWPDGDGDLVAALRTRIAEVVEAGGPQTTLTAPDELPELPIAVRSAAYRVTAEALANVLRHAGAGTCRVTVAVRDGLVVEVVDDGIGLPEHRRPGIGLTAMRDRAAELDGTLQVGAADSGGTAVRLTLPLPA